MDAVEVSPSVEETEAILFHEIEADLETCRSLGLPSNSLTEIIGSWESKVETEPKRFIASDGTINREALRNFRKLQIFISDSPTWDCTNSRFPRITWHWWRRGARMLLQEQLAALQARGYAELLRKHPCPPVGNPYLIDYQGYRYCFRWFKHAYFLGLLNQVLGAKLKKNFVTMDIGSSFGIFSYFVKREYPESHHVLVDFPEQLLLARYFLGSCFPGARIAGIKEVSEQGQLSRDFVESHDFVLVPCTYYRQIASGSIDLVTNFTSLGEMSRKWFDEYLNAPPFQTAKYFFTSNSMAENGITVLDYPVLDPEKRLYFGSCPVYSTSFYRVKRIFYRKILVRNPYFDYIGEV